MSSSHKNAPRNASPEEMDVETYRLPKWDANGDLIEETRRQGMSSEDMEEIEVAPPTAEEIRQIHEDAYNEGFESGYEQGLRQGQQDGQKQGHQEGYVAGEQAGRETGEKAGFESAKAAEEERIQQHLEPLAGVLADLNAALPEQEAALKDGLVALAVRIARNVIDAELTLKPDHIGALVHTAVQALPNADERLTVELHPEDLALVKKVADSHWQLEPKAEISRGGCIVKTRFSYIDYTLEHRYRLQVSNLLAHMGLSEQLSEFERPWPLPAAEPEAEEETSPGEPETEELSPPFTADNSPEPAPAPQEGTTEPRHTVPENSSPEEPAGQDGSTPPVDDDTESSDEPDQ